MTTRRWRGGAGQGRARGRAWHRLALLVPVAVLAAGCNEEQSSLAPKSHASSDIASLFWWMMGIAWVGLVLVVALMLLAWRRSHRKGIGSDDEGPKAGEKTGWRVVVGAGVAFPIVLIAALFIVADIFVIQTTQAPAKGATTMTVRIVGHQWWWEVSYDGTTAVTANEIHIPARTPVRVEVGTADVIHSFWVPRLNRTIDTIPGKWNSIELYADAVGRYRGQCDEFCGLQHAHMAFFVYADPPAVFRRWLANQAKPARAPTSALAKEGEQVFLNGSCATCHQIRGTSADARVGPDLTHLATRQTLAALAIPDDRRDLAEWIVDSQHVKPGNQMPNMNLGSRQLQALVAYLRGLK